MTWRQKVLLQVGLLKLVMTLVAVAGYTTAVTCKGVRQEKVWRCACGGGRRELGFLSESPPCKSLPLPIL